MSEEETLEPVDDIKLIVGLGNPGTEYANTRHNIGFMVIDRLLKDQSVKVRNRCQSQMAEYLLGSGKVILQKPLTYMNSSGDAVKNYATPKIKPSAVLVIYDDLDAKPHENPFWRRNGGHNNKVHYSPIRNSRLRTVKVDRKPGSAADGRLCSAGFSEKESPLIN